MKRLVLAAAAVLIAVTTPQTGHSQGADIFTVAGMTIDREAATAAQARDLALTDGRLAAYATLVARLTLSEDSALLLPAEEAEILPLIRDFSLRNEKTSPVRYIADMAVRFEPQAVREFFQSRAVRFSETVSKPVLVVPVIRFGGALNLWDEPNLWREAWAEQEFQKGLVPLSTPLGDLSDLAAIDAGQAVAGREDLLFALADTYGAEEAVVVLAEPVLDGIGISRIDVTLVRYSRVLSPRTVVDSFQVQAGEDEFALYARAAKGLARRIENDWKRDTLLDFTSSQELLARVPITGLSEYVSIRNRVNRSAPVRSADVLLLGREAAELRLTFLGGLDQLQLALAQADLVLRPEFGEWVIRDANRLPTEQVAPAASPTFPVQPVEPTVIIGGEPLQ